jgi:hypothetical protein
MIHLYKEPPKVFQQILTREASEVSFSAPEQASVLYPSAVLPWKNDKDKGNEGYGIEK